LNIGSGISFESMIIDWRVLVFFVKVRMKDEGRCQQGHGSWLLPLPKGVNNLGTHKYVML